MKGYLGIITGMIAMLPATLMSYTRASEDSHGHYPTNNRCKVKTNKRVATNRRTKRKAQRRARRINRSK